MSDDNGNGNIFNLLGTAFDPSQHQKHTKSSEAQLRDAMMLAGIRPPEELRFDGVLHRFATGKKAGDLSGWYIAHDDKLPAGCFGDWREGVTTNWRADIGRELTTAEKMAQTRRIADMKAQRERITHTILVPAMYNLILLQPDFEQADLSAWRIGGYGGAPMPESTIDALARRLPGLGLINAYGATETTSPTTIMPANTIKMGA